MRSQPEGRCLGLIGGVGVGAAIHYYRELAKAYDARGVGLPLVMAHADMHQLLPRVKAHDLEGMARYLAGLIDRMKAGGAELAAVPAVTPHICIRELTALSPLPLVNVLEAVRDEVRSRGLRKVALFGTRFTIESAMFGALGDVEIVMPRPDELAYIHDTYFQLATSGGGSAEQHAGLTRMAQTLCQRDGVEAILMAGTDLAVIFNEDNTAFPHVDCAGVHIQAILKAMVPSLT